MPEISKKFTYHRQEYSFIFSEHHKELTDNISYILDQITPINKGELCYLNYENKDNNKHYKYNINSIKNYKNINN